MTPNTLRLGRRDDRARYVVGFAFDQMRKQVALIEKAHEPEGADMIGTFNGIGGKCKARESYHDAMVREFYQEAGIIVKPWHLVAIVDGDEWRLYVYCYECDPTEWREIRTLGQSVTDEMVVRFPVRRVLLDNIRQRGGPDRFLYPDVPALVQLTLSDLHEHRAIHIDRRSL